MNVTINAEQRLFVISFEGGSTCLGFDVLTRAANALAAELNLKNVDDLPVGSMDAYQRYNDILKVAQLKNRDTGWRSATGLHPMLFGFEGKKIKVDFQNGTTETFKLGKSTGYVPCHLRIEPGASGGDAISVDEKIVRVSVVQRKKK